MHTTEDHVLHRSSLTIGARDVRDSPELFLQVQDGLRDDMQPGLVTETVVVAKLSGQLQRQHVVVEPARVC